MDRDEMLATKASEISDELGEWSKLLRLKDGEELAVSLSVVEVKSIKVVTSKSVVTPRDNLKFTRGWRQIDRKMCDADWERLLSAFPSAAFPFGEHRSMILELRRRANQPIVPSTQGMEEEQDIARFQLAIRKKKLPYRFLMVGPRQRRSYTFFGEYARSNKKRYHFVVCELADEVEESIAS